MLVVKKTRYEVVMRYVMVDRAVIEAASAAEALEIAEGSSGLDEFVPELTEWSSEVEKHFQARIRKLA